MKDKENKKYVVEFKTDDMIGTHEYWLVEALSAVDALGKAMIITNNPDEGKDNSCRVEAEVHLLSNEILVN